MMRTTDSTAPVCPDDVAAWMEQRLDADEELHQRVAARYIRRHFGADFVYLDPEGNLAIARRVLTRFRRATDQLVVWVVPKGDYLRGYWRYRGTYDRPGRRQYEW